MGMQTGPLPAQPAHTYINFDKTRVAVWPQAMRHAAVLNVTRRFQYALLSGRLYCTLVLYLRTVDSCSYTVDTDPEPMQPVRIYIVSFLPRQTHLVFVSWRVQRVWLHRRHTRRS